MLPSAGGTVVELCAANVSRTNPPITETRKKQQRNEVGLSIAQMRLSALTAARGGLRK